MSTTTEELSKLIERWCRENSISTGPGVSAERLDELKDHLACVAEAQIEAGASVSEAMRFAAEQFGDVSEVREQLTSTQPTFRRWLARIHCCSERGNSADSQRVVLVSLVFAAAILISAWLTKDSQSYAFISTVMIATWIVIASSMGGTRAAARAEWRWIKRKLGF